MFRSRTLPVLCWALLSLRAGVARADGDAGAAPTDPKDVARQRYQRGAAAYAEGHYTDAIDSFLSADRVAPNPAFAYNIGLAYEQLGDVKNALRWYRAYLRESPNAPDRADIEPRIVEDEKKLRQQGLQQVTILSVPPGAELTVDDQRLGITPWTGELAPGRHAVSLEHAGRAPLSDTFELPSDHAIDVSETLKAAAAPAAAPAPAAPPAALEARGPEPFLHRVRPLTWAAFGVAAVGFGASLGFDLARSGEIDDARKAATNLAGKDHYDQAVTDATLSKVMFGAGALFAVAGGVLLYLDLNAHPKTQRTGLGARCGPSFCSLSFDGAL